MNIFESTLKGMELYFTDWKVEQRRAGRFNNTLRIFDRSNAYPLIHLTYPNGETEMDEKVATLQLMHYRNEDDMMAFGSIAASLFGANLATILVVQFEERFATSKSPIYRMSEAYVPNDKRATMRTPYHFGAAFERAVLKHTDSVLAFSPKVPQPLSDGDYYYAIYTKDGATADTLSTLFEDVYLTDEMATIPKRVSDIANKTFVRKTDFEIYKGTPCFTWESGAYQLMIDMQKKCVVSRQKRK